MPSRRAGRPAAWEWRRTRKAFDASTVDLIAVGRDLDGYTGYLRVQIEAEDGGLNPREALWLWRALPAAIAAAIAGSAAQIVRERLRRARRRMARAFHA